MRPAASESLMYFSIASFQVLRGCTVFWWGVVNMGADQYRSCMVGKEGERSLLKA